MRLLVADDDPSLRTAMKLVFEYAGHDVSEAASVLEARDLLDGNLVDLALIDAGMGGTGAHLWSLLEDTEEYRGRVLLITGDLPALGALVGHPNVIGKPFDFAALLARIEETGPRL
jgi:DNA-binding response OmpR family regulator